MFEQGKVYCNKRFNVKIKAFVRKPPSHTTAGYYLSVLWFTEQGSLMTDDDIMIRPERLDDWYEVTDV